MGRIITISGPRGVGKTSVIEKLNDFGIMPIAPYTTRPPRAGEIDGVDYRFVTREHFTAIADQSPMFDTLEVKGSHYGTPFAVIDEVLESDQVRTFNVASHTAIKLRKYGQGVRSIMLLPSTWEDIRQQMRDNGIPDASIEDRIKNEPTDLSLLPQFDHIEINRRRHLDETVSNLLEYIRSLT